MTKRSLAIGTLLTVMGIAALSWAAPKSWSDVIDFTLNTVRASLTTTLAGEDVLNDVQKVEQRFSYQSVSADALVKSGPGFLHAITCNSDAAATAGTLIVYDNTVESGTQIWTWTISAVEYQPRTLLFDVAFSAGLYVGYTTTADVPCTVSYR